MIGIVGRDGGYTAQVADACVIIPTVNAAARHAPHRSLPGRGLAPPGLPPARSRPPRPSGNRCDDVAAATAVFLDRDGVLNRAIVRDGKPYPPAASMSWTSPEAAPALCGASNRPASC